MVSKKKIANSKQGNFGVLVGIDGCGKSTLLKSIKNRKLMISDWKELRVFEEVAFWAPPRPRDVRGILKPMSRAMFVASHLVAEYEYLIEPAIHQGLSVLIDSYYFKWLAKESIYKQTHDMFFSICDFLPRPDVIIHLNIPPEDAYQRKKDNLSPFEYYKEPTLDDFVDFQTKVVNNIFYNSRDIPIITIDATREKEIVQENLIFELTKLGWNI